MIAEVEKRAKDIMDRMFSEIRAKAVRTFAWFMHKVWRQMYEKVVVDEKALQDLKQLDPKLLGTFNY